MLKSTSLFVFACGVLTAQSVSTQVTPVPDSGPPQNATFITSGLAMPDAAGQTIGIVAHEFSFNPGKPITGAPYSGDEVTEHVQTLADGNRIVSTTTTKTYRDSQGRTRTETTLPALSGAPPAPVMITIHDPVAGVTYLLNPNQKTAQKLAKVMLDSPKTKEAVPLPAIAAGEGPGPVVFARQTSLPKADVQTENLGNQSIDGVVVNGTKRIETIPAGAIGNEAPIETTFETWVSPALQVIVKSIHTDPRVGQTTETLNNLSRAEPDPALFQVPGDYSVTDSKGPGPNTFVFRQQ